MTMIPRQPISLARAALALCLLATAALPAIAETVKITPLGSHDGELCRFDRALILEDPDGTRFLYDAGRTVAGAEDPRLGRIDVVLVSHLHGDHVGDRRIARVNGGECAEPETPVIAAPNTNSVEIALAKGATIITGSEMPRFFAAKLKALGGDPSASQLVRFGGSRTVGGVSVTTVPAVHSNGVSGDLIGGKLGDMLDAVGLTAYAGPPTGYVLTFSNGLVVYLSGDTGITAEQESVVRGHYGAKLVVMNIGDTFTTGPNRGGLCHQPADQADCGHRLPRQRGRHQGRQGPPEHQDRDLHPGVLGPRPSAVEWPHHGLRQHGNCVSGC